MTDRIDIELTWQELIQAGMVGIMRRVGSLRRSLDTYKHAAISNWSTDIDGAAAEMAVSKVLQRYWSGHTLNFHGDDVDGGIQVRSTTYETGKLIVRGNDKDESLFVLVVSRAPIYSIRGCLRAKDAKQPYFFKKGEDGADAWWVPQDNLNSVQSLIHKDAA